MSTQPSITLTPYEEAASARKLLFDAMRVSRENIRAYNYCRRVLVILSKAERRKARPRRENKLLTDPEVINTIFNNDESI